LEQERLKNIIIKQLSFQGTFVEQERLYIEGKTAGVIRYYKNGRYIDMTMDGDIISFGKM
jgi:hypothetical protein